MLLGTLGASLLGNLLTGIGKISANICWSSRRLEDVFNASSM